MKHFKFKAIPLAVAVSLLGGCGGSGSDDSPQTTPDVTPEVTPSNTAPVANAGSDQLIELGAVINISGSQSTDADGDELTYNWELTKSPSATASSSIELTDAVEQIITPAEAGEYEITLVVSDGEDQSAPDTILITVVAPNIAPIADAGADISVEVGAEFALDGSGSFDEDGDRLTYNWQVVSAPSEQAASQINFGEGATQALQLEEVGTYEFSLTVSDGEDLSESDTVVVTVVSLNQAPVANIVGTERVVLGEPIVLDGSASADPDGDPLVYSWAFVTVPVGSELTNTDLGASAEVSFIGDVEGEYLMKLVVNDGLVDSSPIIHSATVLANQSPVVRAVVDFDHYIGGEAYIYSKVTDQDSDNHTYSWRFTQVPAGSALENVTSNKPYLAYTPDVVGDYMAQVEVSDGVNTVLSGEVTATIVPRYQYSFNVGIGNTVYAFANKPVLLNFAGADSLNGEALSYSWSVRSGPSGSRPSMTRSLLAPSETEFTGDLKGTYKVRVSVTNESSEQVSKDVTIIVLDDSTNRIPDAQTDTIQYIKLGETIHVDGRRSSDEEGDLLRYKWTMNYQPSVSNLQVPNHDAVSTSLTPTVPGFYDLLLEVTDPALSGRSYSRGAVWVYEEHPTTNLLMIEPETFAVVGDDIIIDNLQLVGADESMTLSWSIISAPYNSSNQLVDSDTVTPKFQLDAEGKYVFQAILKQDREIVDIEQVVVRASDNAKPIAIAGQDISAVPGETLYLDASGSTDAEGSALSYEWQIVGAEGMPSNLPVFDNATSATPSLMLDAVYQGEIVVGLTVSDGDQTSIRDEIVISIASPE